MIRMVARCAVGVVVGPDVDRSCSPTLDRDDQAVVGSRSGGPRREGGWGQPGAVARRILDPLHPTHKMPAKEFVGARGFAGRSAEVIV